MKTLAAEINKKDTINGNGNPLISVVIPVYQCEAFLNELYRRLVASIEPLTENFEILMVEDCGTDHSWPVIEKLTDTDLRVKGIQFSRNFGQHYGITAGLDYCRGDWVVIMDGDLQDRPEEIPRLYEKALEGFDVVLARRVQRQDPALQRFTSWLFYQVFNYFSDMRYDPRVGNFRIISRKVVVSYREMREQLRFLGGLIDWLGFPTAHIAIEHGRRETGKSSYSLRKRWRLAYETIIAYSDKPLKMAIKLGFIMSFFAFCYGAYVIYRSMVHGVAIMGWSSLIVSLYFIGGIIIAILGILGIYLGKTFDEVKKRPLYVVKELKNIK